VKYNELNHGISKGIDFVWRSMSSQDNSWFLDLQYPCLFFMPLSFKEMNFSMLSVYNHFFFADYI